MAEKKWTTEQNNAINARGVNILVSAAAGSGKTTVLIERISRLIIDEEVDVDRFLITTFTNAAASEMRQRLEEKIGAELEQCNADIEKNDTESEKTGNIYELLRRKKFLQRQIRLLPEAHIETFHSFSIGIIRDYFFLTDLQPGFSIGDEIAVNLMKKEVIDAVFERRFSEDTERFKTFLKKYSRERSDEKLKENILEIYTNMLSIPDYMEWAEHGIEALGSEDPIQSLEMDDFLFREAAACLRESARYYSLACELLNGPKTESLYLKARQDVEKLTALSDSLACKSDEYTLQDLKEAIEGTKMNRMVAAKAESEAYDEVKEEVKSARDAGKKIIDDFKKRYFLSEISFAGERIAGLRDDTAYYLDIIRELEERLNEKKKEQNIIDFDDVMHYAIKILRDDKAADDYKTRFRYIFIDEYQDSNYLQEKIVERIAGDNNLFMVGDVKQSIYKFRLAEPEIFQEKYRRYREESDPDSIKIDLNSNFRSKGNIRTCVNAVFESVMEGYDDDAALKGPEGGGEEGPPVELHIIRRPKDPDESEPDDIPELTELSLIGDTIRKYVGTPYTDRSGKQQILRYSDIAVLSRGTRDVAQIERYLNNEDIPAYGVTAGGYYETVEIRVFLDLLRVISNFRQDVPLIAVMSAMFFGFSPSELAEIRISFREGTYCDAVMAYAKEGNDSNLKAKITEMTDRISKWKEVGRTVPLDELIRILIYETGYYDYCCSLPYGERRTSNLRLLIEKAAVFENYSYTGLFGFLAYVDAMKKSSQKVNEAPVSGEGDDVVRIMTVHKSKGLEFPMVILSGAGKRLGGKSSGYDPSIHKDFTIGLPYVDRDHHIRAKTLLQRVISGKKKKEETEEDVRILYVALSRAIDRLVIVGSIPESRKIKSVPSTGSFIDMMYPSVHKLAEEDSDTVHIRTYDPVDDGDLIRDGIFAETGDEGAFGSMVETGCEGAAGSTEAAGGEETAGREETNDAPVADASDAPADGPELEDLRDEINRRLAFVYPYTSALSLRPKYSVTELAANSRGESDDITYLTRMPKGKPSVPELRSLGETEELNAAEEGTVMHLIMEKIDFGRAAEEGSEYVKEVVDELRKKDVISPAQFEVVSTENIAAFFEDPIGKRAAAAPRVRKESEFIMQEMIEGEPVVVQGIIDCWYEEEDGIVLIDYKNSYLKDGMDDSEIVNRYREQVRIYKKALEKAEGKRVKESWIYLFRSRNFLPIEGI